MHDLKLCLKSYNSKQSSNSFVLIISIFLFTTIFNTSLYSAVPDEPVNILFLGNSLTYVNDLPNTLRQVAAAEGITITVTMIANGGWTLNDHLNSTISTDAINAGGWDYVVLQEQSQTSAYFPGQFLTAAAALDALITAAGARTMLYQNWPLNTEMGLQATYQGVWQTAAANMCAVLVPAGDAWYDLYLNDNTTWATLYSDDRHPTQRGAYLTACAFFSVLFGHAPTKPDPVYSLGAALSSQFQASAETAVSPYRAEVNVAAIDSEATEGADVATVRFTVSITDICETIVYYTLSGSASPGVDTGAVSGSVSIPIGATTVDLDINALNDALTEGDETLTLKIWGGPYYSVGASDEVNITIHDSAGDTPTFTQTPTETETVTETETMMAFTETYTQSSTATPTETETGSGSSTYTMTYTETPTEVFTDTVTNTPNETDTPSETATGSPVATWTFTGTYTVTVISTETPTETETVMVIFTDTETPTVTETAAIIFTPTSTPADSDTLVITDLLPYPNPYNSDKISEIKFGFKISQRNIDKLSIKIYTVSYRLINEINCEGNEMLSVIDQGYIKFDKEDFQPTANGIYYYVIIAEKNGKAVRSRIDEFVLLK